ncbi:MAG: phosphatidylserine/phosphatidylglycerophosphate/cardiolipin synthase family protein [Bdellovibrionaceae bacterium]|nr:phosphatidylserine/phosphatidylglycerophosphate/cardiolipin synthase family protein [Pseudobdellovibrionaceae bacterium]
MKKNWQEVQIFHKGDEFFAEMVSGIRTARKSVCLESYIFELDPITDAFLVELQLAVWRGCTVKLLVDGVGSFFSAELLKKRCARDGVQFRIYHPIPGILQWLPHVAMVLFSRAPSLITRINRRNHRKTLIIDDTLAFVGSFNITQLHSERAMGAKCWRDSGVKLKGDALASLSAAFDLAWNFSKNIPHFSLDSNWVSEKIHVIVQWQELLRLNSNNRIRRVLYRDLCRRIRNARTRVYIANAYFLPKRALLKALSKAAQNGVDVQIITPGPTDLPFVKWAAYQIPYKLSLFGVKVFEYQPRIFHAKYMVIDNWSSLGSFNLNHRSLLHDLEVEVVLTDAESLGNLNRQFTNDLSSSKPFDLREYKKSPQWWQWLTKTLFKLRYWF